MYKRNLSSAYPARISPTVRTRSIFRWNQELGKSNQKTWGAKWRLEIRHELKIRQIQSWHWPENRKTRKYDVKNCWAFQKLSMILIVSKPVIVPNKHSDVFFRFNGCKTWVIILVNFIKSLIDPIYNIIRYTIYHILDRKTIAYWIKYKGIRGVFLNPEI